MNLKLKDVFGNLIGKLRTIFQSPSYSRTLILLGIVLLAIIIPVTVVFLGQRTQTQQQAYIDCTGDWTQCAGKSGYCTNINSQHMVHVYQPSRCTTPPTCVDLGLSTSCGFKPKCPSGSPSGSFCSASGTCRAEGWRIGPSCGGGFICCEPPPPTPTPTPDVNSCESKYHTGGQGTCEKYQCANGETNIGGACSFGDSVCCIKKTPTYKCLNPGDPSATAFSGTDGSVTYCPSGKICTNASPNPYPDGNGANDAAKHLCTNTFNPNSCSCEASGNPSDTKFTCAYGLTRTCGSGLVCNNNNKGAQSGLWPCVQNPYANCNEFQYVLPADGTVTDAHCKEEAATKEPKCAYSQFYSLQAKGNWYCVFKPNTDFCEAQNHPFTDAHGTKKTTSDATCQKYQCGTGQHDIGGACSFPDSACCISNSEYGTSSGGGSDCGAENQACCPSGNKCDSGLTCNSSNKCVSTGGGCTTNCGGGGNPTATPTPACTNGKTTQMALNLKLDGIGTGSFDNHSPAHTSRDGIYVRVTDQSGTSLYNNTTTKFNFGNGSFNGAKVSLGTSLVCGKTYTVAVKIPRYLPAKATVDYGTDKTIDLNPIVGDINKVSLTTKAIIGDDKIDINDYAIVRACHNVDPSTPQTFTDGTNQVTITCGELINFLDYTDGGTQGDEWAFNYNAWLRGYVKANGY